MKRKHKEMVGRLVFGIVIVVILGVIIIPKPQNNSSLDPFATPTPQKKAVVKHTVNLTTKGFEPNIILIKKGEVVIWTNNSGTEASINSADYPTHKLFPVLNLGSFKDKQSVQTRIYRIGELRYVNHLNPKQTGTIIVSE